MVSELYVYRIQDAEGRGPWKPGFSHKWIETRPDHDNLLPWYFEIGPVHERACTWESVGSGCGSIDSLRRWFTASEYATLLKYGYRAVRMKVDRILGHSKIQCVFARLKPLAEDVEEIALYDIQP